jgi:hypothetical protein
MQPHDGQAWYLLLLCTVARGPQRREAVTAPPNATERDEEDGGERPFTRHGRGVACALERLADLLI